VRYEYGVFVPAVLSIGLLLSLATLVRDAIHRLRGKQWLSRRSALDGRSTALLTAHDDTAARHDAFGRRSRATYAVIGTVLVCLAMYLTLGAYGNYIGWTGWVKTIGWIWLAYLVFIGMFAYVGIGAVAIAVSWRSPPAWTRPMLVHSPLSSIDLEILHEPRRQLRAPRRAPPSRRLGPEQIDARLAAGLRTVAAIWTTASVVVFSMLAFQDRLPQPSDPAHLETAVSGPVQIALIALVTIGSLVSGRHEPAGAAIMAVAGSALAVISAVQYPPWVAVTIATVFALPAFFHWLAWQRDRHIHHLVALATVTSLLVGCIGVGSAAVYDAVLGPVHPESSTASSARAAVDWAWAGGTTTQSSVVVVKLAATENAVRLIVSEGEMATANRVASVTGEAVTPQIWRFEVEGLRPSQRYAYGVEIDGHLDATDGAFTTFPEGAANFTIAFGSCSRTGSSGSVFDAIRRHDPLLYLAIGDLHYSNIRTDDLPRFLEAYDRTLAAPAQGALYRSTSTAYVWDDHDFGGNDADRRSPSRPAAQAAYRLAVPHAGLAAPAEDGAIYQAFTIGRIRVVLTDLRSHREPDADDAHPKTMLGAAQLAWFEDELRTAASGGQAVLWISSSPWIDTASPQADSWGGFDDERRHIAKTIRELGLGDRLVMLGGDAHMLAFDDGSHSAYDGPGSGFPVVHAGALDRPGGTKGGPYSLGPFPGGGQYGTLDVRDDGGGEMTIAVHGLRWDGQLLIDREVRLRMP